MKMRRAFPFSPEYIKYAEQINRQALPLVYVKRQSADILRAPGERSIMRSTAPFVWSRWGVFLLGKPGERLFRDARAVGTRYDE
jgi:hypothetical protein